MKQIYNEGKMGMEANVCQHCGQAAFVVKEKPVEKKGLMYVVMGWIFAALAVVYLPIIFGGMALYIGANTFFDYNRTHGAILMACAMFATIIGLLFSTLVAGTFVI
ncbi:hypothetical protein DRW41_10525 [Neobacillus piezotolerans]|uniref:Uncharacterized protein n=1 Tax=Neobacillus piezotolerans TaxID=2259171 RepID=A0A3D8GSB6_9BACI|nr:hypothetical protein [Neobacillus piezotolerans]RDU37109.1 hypothetical protein DRW41_10525 [Neobacillus piezotolerans]